MSDAAMLGSDWANLRTLLDAADDALDKETYEQKRKDNFDPPLDAEYYVTVGTIQKINAVFQALDAKLSTAATL